MDSVKLDIKRIAAGHQEIRYKGRLWIAQTENFYSTGILQSKKWLLFEEDMSSYLNIFPSFKAITKMLSEKLGKEAHDERLRTAGQRYPVTSYMGFATPFDTMPENLAKRKVDYDRGMNIGMNAKRVVLDRGLRWEAMNLDGSYTVSYEKLGYHANTAYFYAGLIASGVHIDWYSDKGLVTVQTGIDQILWIQIKVKMSAEELSQRIAALQAARKPYVETVCKFCGQKHETRNCGYLV